MIASEVNVMETMNLTINGKPRNVDPVRTVGELLRRLDLDPRQVVVELRGTIIRRKEVDQTPVQDSDELEILRFVGGG